MEPSVILSNMTENEVRKTLAEILNGPNKDNNVCSNIGMNMLDTSTIASVI
jgi:hypothetical protein